MDSWTHGNHIASFFSLFGVVSNAVPTPMRFDPMNEKGEKERERKRVIAWPLRSGHDDYFWLVLKYLFSPGMRVIMKPVGPVDPMDRYLIHHCHGGSITAWHYSVLIGEGGVMKCAQYNARHANLHHVQTDVMYLNGRKEQRKKERKAPCACAVCSSEHSHTGERRE